MSAPFYQARGAGVGREPLRAWYPAGMTKIQAGCVSRGILLALGALLAAGCGNSSGSTTGGSATTTTTAAKPTPSASGSASGKVTASASPKPSADKPTTDAPDGNAAALEALGKAAGCPSKDGPHGEFCIAANDWASGTAAPLPAGFMLGESVFVAKSPAIDFDKVELVALLVREDGGKQLGTITRIIPENKDEEAASAANLGGLHALFGGKGDGIKIPTDLFDFLKVTLSKAKDEITKDAKGWKITAKRTTEIRLVKQVWVALEVDADGTWVGLLTPNVSH
jgi:hypothetical protein